MSVINSMRNLQVEYMYEDVSLTHSCHPCTRLVIATWPVMEVVSTEKAVLKYIKDLLRALKLYRRYGNNHTAENQTCQ